MKARFCLADVVAGYAKRTASTESRTIASTFLIVLNKSYKVQHRSTSQYIFEVKHNAALNLILIA